MAAPPPPRPTGSPYEITTALLTRASTPLPSMVVLDADHVLWPCSSSHLSGEVQPYPDVQGVLSGLHAAGIKLGVIAVGSGQNGAAGPSNLVQAALDRIGLQGIIDNLHVYDAVDDDSSGAPSQAQIESHWQDHRRASGVPWSSCIALVGGSSSLRAANRAGAGAVVHVRAGLTPDVLANALEIWATKLEGDRGF